MNVDILGSLSSALGGPVTRHLSEMLGENEDRTRSALRVAGPGLLAGLMQQATTPTGVAKVFDAVNDDRVDSGIVSKLGGILSNRGSIDSMRGTGESLLGSLFGNRSGALTNAVSEVAGVRGSTASSLLSLGLPLILGVLRKYVASGGLNASGLASLLFSQRGALERTGLDDRVTNALGFSNLSSLLGSVPTPEATTSTVRNIERRVEPERQRSRPWIPWAIAAGVAALAFLLMFNRPTDRAEIEGAQVTAATDSARVYFGSGETTIDEGDRAKIASIVQAAQRDDRPITITGYTDRSGDPQQNAMVAKNRAEAVRDALVAGGIDQSRILMNPPAQLTGTGTDDEARRVDIAMR